MRLFDILKEILLLTTQADIAHLRNTDVKKNFVIMITDGESTKDTNLPGTCFSGYGSSVRDSEFDVQDYMDDIASIEGYSSQRCSTANSMDGTFYLEGVSYYAHTNDLLSSFDGMQNLSIYTIFCFDQSSTAKDILKKSLLNMGHL